MWAITPKIYYIDSLGDNLINKDSFEKDLKKKKVKFLSNFISSENICIFFGDSLCLLFLYFLSFLILFIMHLFLLKILFSLTFLFL